MDNRLLPQSIWFLHLDQSNRSRVLAFAGDFVDYSDQREECRKDSISIISQRMYNMKQISIIIALALLTTIANAQNISSSHQVRANDEVKKQQVEYAAVDSTGQNMVWDLSEMVLPKWTLTADYTEQIRVIDEVACQSKSPLIYDTKN